MVEREWTPGSVTFRSDRNRWQCRIRWREVENGEPGPWHQLTEMCPEGIKAERAANIELDRWRKQLVADYERQRAEEAEEAEEAERKSEAAAEAARQAEEDAMTVERCVGEYIDTLEASESVEPSTVRGYRATAKYLTVGENAIGAVPMARLGSRQAQLWVNGLTAEGLGSSTVGKAYRLANQVYRHAVAIAAIDRNPFDAVRPPKRKSADPNALDATQAARLTGALLAASDPSPVMAAAALALFAGLREGECAGLRWDDVMLTPDGGALRVRQAIGNGESGTYAKEPKTQQSRRTIPVTPELAKVLAARRRSMEAQRRAAGVPAGPGEMAALYVCGPATGGFTDPWAIGRGWAQVARALSLVGTRGRVPKFHDLRHTYATLAIAGGADVRSVAAVMGHTNVAMTLNTYADATPEGKALAVRAVSEAVGRHGGELLEFSAASGGER